MIKTKIQSGSYEIKVNGNKFLVVRCDSGSEWEFSIFDKEKGFFVRMENCASLKDGIESAVKYY